MTRTKLLLTAVLALGAAFLSGCLFVSAPPTGEIEGYVVNHLSGEAVAGAKVTAFPAGGLPGYVVGSDYFGPYAVTDANGYYKVRVPKDPNPYTIEIRKEGHATSRIEGILVTSTVRVDTVLKPVANPNWSLTPPTVTVTGVTDGMTISGPISVKIDATGPNHIQHIYAAFGKMPGAALLTSPRAIYSNTATTGTFTINPATYGVAGETTFEVVVYDWNENRTHRIYRVYVTPGADGPVSPPREPTAAILTDTAFGVLIPARVALAVTQCRQIGYLGEPLDPLAAPAGANVYVELRWRNSTADTAAVTGDGYRIYRRLAGETEFRRLYTVDATGASTYIYRDSTPDLEVGREAVYRITYFRGGVESDPLEGSATPLPTWTVRLTSPADEAANVSLYPTFTWTPSPAVGTTQFYAIVLWDFPHGDAGGVIIRTLNTTSATFTGISGGAWERLQPYRMYHWEMYAAFGIDLAQNAVSIFSNNNYTTVFPRLRPLDAFTFTTGDW